MKIYLAHIHYTVNVRKFKDAPEEVPNALAYVRRLDENSCVVYLSGKQNPGDVAHELTHVLQNICLARNIEFSLEREHMGYIMHYLMGKILGYQWK